MPQPYPDKYSAASQGLLQGVQAGSMIGQIINQGERNRIYDKRYTEALEAEKAQNKNANLISVTKALYGIPKGQRKGFAAILEMNGIITPQDTQAILGADGEGEVYEKVITEFTNGNRAGAWTAGKDGGLSYQEIENLEKRTAEEKEKTGMQNAVLSKEGIPLKETFTQKTYNMTPTDYNQLDKLQLGGEGQGLLSQYKLATLPKYNNTYHSPLSEEDRLKIASDKAGDTVFADKFTLNEKRPSLLEGKKYSNDTPEQIKTRNEILNLPTKMLEDRWKGEKGKEFAPSLDSQYVPIGNGKYQLKKINRTDGTATAILDENGNPIIQTHQELIESRGGKTESVTDPYQVAFGKEHGKKEAEGLSKARELADEAINSLEIVANGRDIVKKGIYTGSAANIKLKMDKWLQEVGVNVGGQTASNTEAYASLMGNMVGKVIKQFGSGTGLSDADREYAQKIAGGEITLTQQSIEKLLDINEKLAKFTLRQYNKKAKEAKTKYGEKYINEMDMPIIETPSPTPNRRATDKETTTTPTTDKQGKPIYQDEQGVWRYK